MILIWVPFSREVELWVVEMAVSAEVGVLVVSWEEAVVEAVAMKVEAVVVLLKEVEVVMIQQVVEAVVAMVFEDLMVWAVVVIWVLLGEGQLEAEAGKAQKGGVEVEVEVLPEALVDHEQGNVVAMGVYLSEDHFSGQQVQL